MRYLSVFDNDAEILTAMSDIFLKGKWHLDWDNPKDRLALVKDCGFSCDPDYFNLNECEKHCSAKEYCDRYRDYMESEDTE